MEGAIAYAIFKNGEFVAIVENESSYEIEAAEGDEFSIRSANSMGGFGEAAIVKMESAETTPKPELIHTASASWSSNTGKNSVDSETEYYNNDASTGWAGVAFAEFKMNVPAGATITGAELTWTTITGTDIFSSFFIVIVIITIPSAFVTPIGTFLFPLFFYSHHSPSFSFAHLSQQLAITSA